MSGVLRVALTSLGGSSAGMARGGGGHGGAVSAAAGASRRRPFPVRLGVLTARSGGPCTFSYCSSPLTTSPEWGL